MAERIKDYVITGVKHLRIQTPPAKRHGLNNMADQARILEAGLTLARAVTFHVDVLTMNGHAIEDGLLPLKLDLVSMLPSAQLTEQSISAVVPRKQQRRCFSQTAMMRGIICCLNCMYGACAHYIVHGACLSVISGAWLSLPCSHQHSSLSSPTATR